MNTEEEIKVGDIVIWRDGGGEKRKVTALSPDGVYSKPKGSGAGDH